MGNLLEKLYSREVMLEVYLENEQDRDRWFSVELTDSQFKPNPKPDCKVGNFGANYWFRTNKGVNGEKYSSMGHLLRAIYDRAKKSNLEATHYRIIDQEPTSKDYDYRTILVEEGNINEFISV